MPANAVGLFKEKGEHIIISGGPASLGWEGYRQPSHRHDKWWGNFVRSARRRMQQIRKEDPNGQITWLVYKPAYTFRSKEDGVDLISNVLSVRDLENVRCKLVWFNNTDQLINYVNNGGAGLSRSTMRIATFEYFGHSNRHCFTFDYSGEVLGASRVFLHEKDLPRFKRSAFARGCSAKSWGCHTGESMSLSFKQATGVKMKGAIGKTDYSQMWVSEATMPTISTVGGHWTR